MQIGYARVSTDDQDTAVQVTALKSAGCERIYREKASGGRWDRPELHPAAGNPGGCASEGADPGPAGLRVRGSEFDRRLRARRAAPTPAWGKPARLFSWTA